MLSRPPALNETEDRGRSLAAVGPPPALPLADEEDASQTVSPPPPAPPPPRACCPCASLLPRLLSAHRLEVRRLLRGALASLGRRLDSLERRSHRRNRQKRRRPRGEEGGATCSSPGPTEFTSGHTSSPSISHAQLPPATTSSSSSSSSESEESPNQSGRRRRRRRNRGKEEEEEEEGRGRKRWRRSSRAEDCGRFVGQMAVSIRGGAEEEGPLTLHSLDHGGAGQSQKAVSIVVRQNGYSLSSSQHALFLQSAQSGRTFSQSEGFNISSGQWHFSDFSPPPSLSSNHRAFHLWLCSSSSSSSPALILRLSALSVQTVVSVRGEGCSNPLRPLKDFTAPPTVSSDHCYIRALTPSLTLSARRQRQRANHSSRSLHLPRRRAPPLPPCSANGLSATLKTSQSAASSEYLSKKEERGKRVSQIRIRRASPRETPLTPMGLPKVKRLRKKEFSLEEIYTNKNYKSPSTNRSLETIFEEPREKDGALLLIGQQRRRRVLLFPDFTQPRKRKRPLGAGIPVATVPRKRAAARRHYHGNDDDGDLDVMLVERLSALEDFLTRQGLDDDV
ncbi:uncharacterized protein LOC115416642 isoform X2 [Sphaeramia orbicularis]|uniref:Uncharacterized LOC115416642 n=1 Tax=Sphaeramia orbicularis TaxID=375764 RepID=A0A672Y890_9TELE|nr:uncharacterized protein LOC115416642 isoform X2 [Sphaeramia orbicularis]